MITYKSIWAQHFAILSLVNLECGHSTNLREPDGRSPLVKTRELLGSDVIIVSAKSLTVTSLEWLHRFQPRLYIQILHEPGYLQLLRLDDKFTSHDVIEWLATK